jgi:hypothetical protein
MLEEINSKFIQSNLETEYSYCSLEGTLEIFTKQERALNMCTEENFRV